MKWVFILVGGLGIGMAVYFGMVNDMFSFVADAQQEQQVVPQKNDEPLDESRFDDPEYWRSRLTDEQFHVTREKGTEPPFKNAYWNNKKPGTYRCICCNEPLFESTTKFESGTGWPSFYAPINDENVAEKEDRSHNMVRTEVLCAKCNAHLGHVFANRRQPTGLRYCINSAALTFDELTKDDQDKSDKESQNKKSDDQKPGQTNNKSSDGN